MARDLLGKVLVHDSVAGRRAVRIVEVEAYLGDRDPASHAFRGRTARTAPMFGPPGRSYVYLSHGVWYCMNVVAETAGIAGAVLLRGAEPVEGVGDDPRRLAGPGLLCRALGITGAHTDLDLVRSTLTIREAAPVPAVRVARGRRVGIDPAGRTADRPWRWYVRASAGVSR